MVSYRHQITQQEHKLYYAIFMKRIYTFLILFSFCAAIVPAVVSAADFGLGVTANRAGLGPDDGYGQDLPVLIGNIIGTGLSMIAVLFFILMVYGGFLWMTAHGNEEQTSKAFDTIIAATVGLIIIMASFAITNFVFNSVSNTPEPPSTPIVTPPTGP